jgi:hypothetical protein
MPLLHRTPLGYLARLRARLCVAGLILAGSGVAQICQAAQAENSALLVCSKLESNSERLACYDRLASQLRSKPDVQPVATAASPSDMFGLTPATDAAAAQKAADRTLLQSITARVTSLHETARNGAVLELDNGQRWQQIGNEDLLLRVGDTVKISRGMMGSLWLMAPSNHSAHVKRLR